MERARLRAPVATPHLTATCDAANDWTALLEDHRSVSTTRPLTPRATSARELHHGEWRRANTDADDRMIPRKKPAHHAVQFSLGDGHATLRRRTEADVEEESAPRPLHDGVRVVVDHHRVRVRATRVVEVLGVPSR